MTIDWKKQSRVIIPAICVILIAGFFIFFRSQNDDGTSLLTTLDKVDTSIRTGQTYDALKLLKKAQKSAYSSYARIGIYRRYMTLGEKKLAEKTLVKGLKKIPENPELSAVYGHFLLKEDRVSEAIKVTKCLSGTPYGSLYSESCLRSISKDEYYSNDFVSVYLDAYNATENGKWLVNAALPFLRAGDYEGASSLQDDIYKGQNQFWALVHYDAGNFDLAVENCLIAGQQVLDKSSTALLSDAYVKLGDYDSAEKERSKLISRAQLEYNIEVPSEIIVNSAIWAYNAQKYNRAYDLLTTLVMRNSQDVNALLTYGKFALKDSQEEEQDVLETYLRKTDLRSLSMIRRDERPKFLVSDAIFRIDETLKAQKTQGKSLSDELLVEKLNLYLCSHSELPQKSLESEIWKTLEINELGTNLYPPLLVNYCVSKLLNYGKTEDARNLFTKYLDARYRLRRDEIDKDTLVYDVFGGEKKYVAPPVPDFVMKAAFGNRASEYVSTMEVWEIELAAYFSLIDENMDAAKRLYEYAVFETGGVNALQKNNAIIAISPLAQVTSATNLAMLYAASGDLRKSVSLFGLASGRTRDKKIKSRILYKTALVQIDLGNTDEAVLSLNYAISLDPMNANARLLRKKIK